jgi:tetratricopeptide (TPR) repeat protein
MALALEPDLAQARLSLGVVRVAQRRLRDAQQLLNEARALLPLSTVPLLQLARLAQLRGEEEAAKALLTDARALDPEDDDVVIALGRIAVHGGRTAEARELAALALKLTPDGVDAHVLAGDVALRAGDVASARAHALTALGHNATHAEALRLLASIRARESWLLGLWWRYHAWMTRFGQREYVPLILMFVAARLAFIALDEAGADNAASLAQNLWLAFCAYTWIGPVLFRRAVAKELATIRLRRDF